MAEVLSVEHGEDARTDMISIVFCCRWRHASTIVGTEQVDGLGLAPLLLEECFNFVVLLGNHEAAGYEDECACHCDWIYRLSYAWL